MIKHTTYRDVNGNKRAKIEVAEIGRIYAEFCSGARIHGDAALNMNGVIERLKKAFGYRHQKKAAVPSVSCTFEGENEMKAEIMDAIVYAVTGGRLKYSRVRYMDGLRRCSHHEYYAQFVTDGVRAAVNRELKNLLKSTKPHFNDNAALTKHAAISGEAAELCRIAQCTTYSGYKCGGTSEADATCVQKAAARDMVADYLRNHDDAKKTTAIDWDKYTVTEYYNGFHFEYDGRVVTAKDIIARYINDVPRSYPDLYSFLASFMLLDENKAMLKRIINSSNAAVKG